MSTPREQGKASEVQALADAAAWFRDNKGDDSFVQPAADLAAKMFTISGGVSEQAALFNGFDELQIQIDAVASAMAEKYGANPLDTELKHELAAPLANHMYSANLTEQAAGVGEAYSQAASSFGDFFKGLFTGLGLFVLAVGALLLWNVWEKRK